jgi:hypothetical protein
MATTKTRALAVQKSPEACLELILPLKEGKRQRAAAAKRTRTMEE